MFSKRFDPLLTVLCDKSSIKYQIEWLRVHVIPRELDLHRQLFSVPAGSPAREWGRIEGAALVNFQADVQLRRGVILEIGGEALAYLDGQ
ncbi:MAG: hypothetical protein ACXWIJ_23695, partial [Burkholderiales bacterium]